MATNSNFFWAGAVGSGLIISIPHCAKGQGLEIEIKSCTGRFQDGSKSLAAITLSGIIGNISFHGLPRVPLSMGSMGQCSDARVISAYSFMQLS